MEKKLDQTPKAADVKKKLEALVGHRIEASGEELIRLVFAVGAFAFEDGNVTSRSIFFPSKTCSSGRLLDASGVSSTGTDGKRVFLLGDFVCFPEFTQLRDPVNVVATPRAESPFFVTMTHSLVNTPATDVQITVFAWDASGAPAPNVVFDWRCLVPTSQFA